MSIAQYIKEIGRGKEGARSLTQVQAYDLMSQVLDGHVTDLEVGAFALAMRIKGETTEELAGFLEAANERCMPVRPQQPAVLLASYNGARKLPNLTPLLALLLAQEGVPVLVHGPAQDPGRVTTAAVFHDLGLPPARDATDVESAWARHEPAFMRIEQMCPPLAKLLDVRWAVGLRNPGHTVAKLLDPCRSATSDHPLPALRAVNYTHPEYGKAHQEFLEHTRANALLLRGTEGEPVADPRRAPRMDVYIDGVLRDDLSRPAHEGVLTELPVLPRECDAATTAHYIQSVISGEKPAPGPLQQQVECILRALAALPESLGSRERSA